MDAIHGVTLETMAETMSKHNELRAQYGEPGFKPHFLAYLGSKGLDEAGWAQAWNSWTARLDADRSGQLWARYHQIESELSMTAHFGGVEDMSQQVRGGLTLDMYARLSAELAQPGADFNAVLARHDVGPEVWNLGREAWNEAMSQDTMHTITTQYGRLYAKYDPAHAAAMQQQAGQIAAGRAQASAQPDAPEEEYTPEKALEEVRSATPGTRWRAAHMLAQMIQTELADDPRRRQQALVACVPQLIAAIERHDRETVGSAEAAARDLVELEQFNDDTKGALSRALLRGQEHLAGLRAAFVPIQDRNVPERIHLQSEIQDYTSLVETLEEILGEWDERSGREARGAAEQVAEAAGEAAEGGASEGGVTAFFRKIVALFRG